MTELGIFEVKTHFSEIVDRVLREGRPITVTRRGKPVVDIVPRVDASEDVWLPLEEALEVLEELRSEVTPIGFEEIQSMVAEGRNR